MIHTQFAEITDAEFFDGLPLGNRVITTLEGENPGGSIKDHMVRAQLEKWILDKKVNSGTIISELSSGSTALSLAYYCQKLHLNCVIYLPSSTSAATIKKLQHFGIKIELLEPIRAYDVYNSLAIAKDLLQFNQLFDSNKKQFYLELARKIFKKYPKIGSVIGATGTGHSLLGIVDGIFLISGVRPELISAEPSIPLMVPGCRNLETERYGDLDSCQPSLMDARITIASMSDLWPKKTIQTNLGNIAISESFQLVLGAVRKYLQTQNNTSIFAIGACNKRAAESQALPKAS